MKGIPTILLVFLTTSCYIQCQESKKEHKQVHLLQIESDCIYPPLDRAIDLFNSIDSQNDTLLFAVDIVKRSQDSVYSLLIEYETNLDLCFNYVKPVYGFCYYRNCLFVVNSIDSEKFFSKKDCMMRFEYTPNSDEQLVIIDDSRPYWEYYYCDGKFILIGESIPSEYRNLKE